MDYPLVEQYWIWLSAVEGMTPRKFYTLIAEMGDARAVWDDADAAAGYLDEKTGQALKAARSERVFYKTFSDLDAHNICAITRLSNLYPERLINIVDAPPTLSVEGDTNLSIEKAFAIVGTRAPTFEGSKTAREFARALAENNVCVISGLARGVDTCAHNGCLEADGRTIAVLGCGLARTYPPENEALRRRIVESGGSILSEMRLDDGPQKWSFPARNRIISGLSAGVMVVEGKLTSGAMITADHAAEQSRDVFAVPGSIYAPLSEAPNRLIQSGAMAVTNAWDILEAYRWAQRPRPGHVRREAVELNEIEKKLRDLLINEPLSFEELVYRTGISASELNSLLTMLILRGIIVKAPGNYYRAY